MQSRQRRFAVAKQGELFAKMSKKPTRDREIMQTFAIRVMELRHQAKLTQGEVGELIGVGRTSIAVYESQISMASIGVVVKYARAFGVTTDYLLGLTDQKHP